MGNFQWLAEFLGLKEERLVFGMNVGISWTVFEMPIFGRYLDGFSAR